MPTKSAKRGPGVRRTGLRELVEQGVEPLLLLGERPPRHVRRRDQRQRGQHLAPQRGGNGPVLRPGREGTPGAVRRTGRVLPAGLLRAVPAAVVVRQDVADRHGPGRRRAEAAGHGAARMR
ncbi:hypothetical protein, partial [Streptomyces sp. Tu 6176]|uniref:hypothetical protein n=1 Tax=Streptomyces sp. Tu 6176 TaxID=1470557 RepID=UPI001F4539C2